MPKSHSSCTNIVLVIDVLIRTRNLHDIQKYLNINTCLYGCANSGLSLEVSLC